MRPLHVVLATACLFGCAPAGTDGDDSSDITIRLVGTMTINAIDVPAGEQFAGEGQRLFAHFTLHNGTFATMNGRVGATITPAASPTPTVPAKPAYNSTHDFLITSLQSGQDAQGVVVFDAPPAAAGNLIDVHFIDGTTGTKGAAATRQVPTSAQIKFAVDPVNEGNPRSQHNDTVYLAIGGTDGRSDLGNAAYLGWGQAGTQFPGITSTKSLTVIPDWDTVDWAMLLINYGHPGAPPVNLQNLAAAAHGIADGTVDQFTIHNNSYLNIYFPDVLIDCDGLLAAERLTESARDLVDNATLLNFTIPGATENSKVVTYTGWPSPVGCGEVSHYTVKYHQIHLPGGHQAGLISPPLAVTSPGGTEHFTFDGGPATWSVEGSPAIGSIDQSGNLQLTNLIGYNQFAIVHAAPKDGSPTATAYITVAPHGGISFPRPITIGPLPN
jgi:hypothetical protein